MACTYRHVLIKYVFSFGGNIANTATNLFQSKSQLWSFDVFFVVRLTQAVGNKKSTWLWSAMPWCSCEVIVMRRITSHFFSLIPWWHHQMEKIFTLLILYEGNPMVTGGFPSQRPVMWSFHVNKWVNKQSRRWWFETPSCSLWHNK